jgi:hypothetical protein
MADQGQLQPIVVRRDSGDGYCLVAGLHRLEAARKLNWKEIRCSVFDDMDADRAELVEIDENLIRANLTPAEEAAHMGRRKQLYERLHPETKHGAVGRRGKRSQNATPSEPADAFIDDIAKKTGKHRATIARKTARARKVAVLSDVGVRRAEDIAPAFEALKGRAEALYVVSDPLVISNRIRFNTLALGARLPTVYSLRENVDAGGLMSYGPNLPDQFRRAADFVDKILRGTKPADIPVEQPTRFDLVINLTTTRALGLTIPETLLATADEVIQ